MAPLGKIGPPNKTVHTTCETISKQSYICCSGKVTFLITAWEKHWLRSSVLPVGVLQMLFYYNNL